MMRHNKKILSFVLLTILLVVFFVLDISLGSITIPFEQIVATLLGSNTVPDNINNIVLNFRLPKAIVAILAGTSLSISGLQMQTTFRNPLADPYVLGISAGASLGVALFLLGMSAISMWAIGEFIQTIGIAMAAWLGAALVLMLVLMVSIRVRDVMSVLILGVMFGGAVSAIVGVLQFFSTESMLKTYIIWTMGSLGGVSINQLYIMIVAIFIGIIISLFSIKILNAMLLGDNYAQSMGLNVRKARVIIFMSTSLLAGTVTAFCGPIGFIGIAVPHLARMIFREADHRFLLPATMLLGANIMLICDILSQSIQSNAVLPINTITALLGIPIVIYVIIRHQKSF